MFDCSKLLVKPFKGAQDMVLEVGLLLSLCVDMNVWFSFGFCEKQCLWILEKICAPLTITQSSMPGSPEGKVGRAAWVRRMAYAAFK